MSDEPTFRDFAAAIMSGELERSALLLEGLLGVDAATATAAATHFKGQLDGGPEFMMKAMSMRQVVESGNAAQIGDLLRDLFALDGTTRETAIATIQKRYGH